MPTRYRRPAVRYNGKRLHRIPKPSVPVLDPEPSAALRDKLVGEIARLQSAETAVAWASRGLIAKNRLVARRRPDASKRHFGADTHVRGGLPSAKQRSATNDPANGGQPQPTDRPLRKSRMKKLRAVNASDAAPSSQQVNSGNGKLRRFRDKEHLRFVSKQPCTVCGRQPCEPHHIRFAQPRAISRKVSDEFTVPLCRVHHREIHRRGDEAAWWAEFGVNPMPIALRLWQQTRGIGSPPDEKPRSVGEIDSALGAGKP